VALTLGRKPGQTIVLQDSQGREVHIEVMEADNMNYHDYMRFRITAPEDIKIIRGELISGNDSKE
jgi:sRNA-binding carbon storage regulator CsrA